MYPSYKEFAINALMGEFIRLVNCQTEKAVFCDEMVGLRSDHTSPVMFSSRDIIDIVRTLKEMPKPTAWDDRQLRAVYELAAKAEQNESDCQEHLKHVMMSLYFELKDHDTGRLWAKVDKENQTLKVFLEDEFSHQPALPILADVMTKPYDNRHFAITAATLYYDESKEDWTLCFSARSLDDGKEEELPDDAVDESIKKDIADYMIEEARKDPSDDTPLERLADKWIAPRKGMVEVDGTKIRTAITSITSANILTVEAGTTGYKGGDSGHGGRTYLRIKDDSSTDMRCTLKGVFYDEHGRSSLRSYDTHNANQIEIILGGDTELDTFISALRFAADVLEKKANGQLILEVPKDNT